MKTIQPSGDAPGRVPPGAALDLVKRLRRRAATERPDDPDADFAPEITWWELAEIADLLDEAASALDAPRALARFDISDLGVVLPDPDGAYVLYEDLAALNAQPPQAPQKEQ